MAGVNKVILLGRLGSDPEVRTLPSGGKVVTFSIATSESYNNKEGVKVEQTEWHRIELWEGLANIAEQYLKKGDMAYIEGRIRTEKWTDKEGIERNTVKIFLCVGNGIGPVTTAPVLFTVFTIFSADLSTNM
jgi:single-strand DNA-binding protein